MSSSADRVDKVSGRTLKQTEVDYMKIIERQNLERVTKLRRQKTINNRVGLTIGGTVIGIYLYTILSVKQEKFLDDFSEPKKISNE